MALLVLIDPAIAAFPPSRVVACFESLVLSKRFRMVPSPADQDYQRTTGPFGKEVIMSLTNGLHLYSGEGDDCILSSAFTTGHRVQSCLHPLPQYCPHGDDRGKLYRLVDLQMGARAGGWSPGTSTVAPWQSPSNCFVQAAPGGSAAAPPCMFGPVLSTANPAPVSYFIQSGSVMPVTTLTRQCFYSMIT